MKNPSTSWRSLAAMALASLALSSFAPIIVSAQTADVTVQISKYVDGQPSSATSAQSVSFPMQATWNSTSTGASSGTFSLGPTGFNSADPYTAITAPMSSGASYAVSEQTDGAVVGADCSGTQPFALAGYTTGSSLASAAAATPSSSSPSLTNLTSNSYVIVWNKHCLAAPQPLSPDNGSATTSSTLLVDWTDVSNAVGGITYVFQDSNSSTTDTSGAFTAPVFTSPSRTQSDITGASLAAGTYYWHVQATDAAGNKSAWSPTWSFIVNGTTPTPTSTVKVHIEKYLDGALATASSANNYLFPMVSTWQASNLNSGASTSGTYVLGNGFGGASAQYGADTAAMNTPASYTTNEVTDATSQVLPASASCVQGKYQIVGYATSNVSFADAASQSPTTSAPSFSGLNSDAYVIVWNKTCGTTTPPTQGNGTLVVYKYALGGDGTFHFRGNHAISAFDITTTNGFGSSSMSVPAGRYNISEQGQQGWTPIFTSCHNVKVVAGQSSSCFVANLSFSFFPHLSLGHH